MIRDVLVLGAGSAGLLAALTIKRKIPQLSVRLVRSSELGVIGVGEGTTPNLVRHLFDYLRIPRKRFYELAEPTWKLGIRFEWGPRGRFDYTFDPQLDRHWSDLARPNGFYCDGDFSHLSLPAALMRHDKVFPRQPDGCPDVQPWHAFHLENEKFVALLEQLAAEEGVEILEGRVRGCERGEQGVEALQLEDGRRLEADFFLDASGFRSELLGKALEEPFDSFARTLFCDRAVIGGWERGDEPILPYTTAETMRAGWSWQIEHQHHINRGYVFCSDFLSDDEAVAEFRLRNPKLPEAPRVVKFRSGAYRRLWVDNVVAIGNAAGFVEPLEATALMIVCAHSQTIVDFLLQCALEPTPGMRELYNERVAETWADIRDFLGLHYFLNRADDSPFWRRCQEETDLSGIGGLLEFYEENGPTGFCRYRIPHSQSDFGLEGYLVMLVGNRHPYRKRHRAGVEELTTWESRRSGFASRAKASMSVSEALAYVQHPGWKWHGDP